MNSTYHLGRTLSKNQWVQVISNPKITYPKNIEIIQILYSFHGHQASASQIGKILGYSGLRVASPVNSSVGNWGKRLLKIFPFSLSKRADGSERKWDLFFDGNRINKIFYWKLKNELKEAMVELEINVDEQEVEEIPIKYQEILTEGAKKTIVVNSYERNNKARQKCIEHYGSFCQVCLIDFEKVYGEIGRGFIHVHHKNKISEIKKNYEICPFNDLIPICPNCHAMIHKKDPPYSIEDLKNTLKINSDHLI